MKQETETKPEPRTLLFVTHPGHQTVRAKTYADAVKQAPPGETIVGIHAADLSSTRGKPGMVKRS